MNILKRFPKYDRVIYMLVALYILPELAFWLSDFVSRPNSTSRNITLQNFGFWPGLLTDWTPNYAIQPYSMFLTYGFLHTGLWHLIFNSITLLSLGQALIEDVGVKRFLNAYIFGLFAGASAYALLSDNIHPMVGASGALFAIAGALLWHQVFEDAAELSIKRILRTLAIPVLWLIALNAVMYIALGGRLAWEAHLGGFIGGFAAMFLTSNHTNKAK